MAKYIYVGDPNTKDDDGNPDAQPRTTFVDRDHNRSFTMKRGEPTEVPEWLEPRLKNNTHFKAAGGVKAEAKSEPKDK